MINSSLEAQEKVEALIITNSLFYIMILKIVFEMFFQKNGIVWIVL